jgi:ribose transport system substrate-binding protein
MKGTLGRTGRLIKAAAGLAIVGLAVAACGSTSGSSASSSSGSEKTPHVAFFGFAAANSFAQATYKGVQQAVHQLGGTAHFFDGNFSATTQVSQMQDATASGQYNVFVVQANDGSAVVPYVKQAIAKGIVVVAEFTPVGANYATVAPQVPGEISVVQNIVGNGKSLGQLGTEACGSLSTCNVVFLQGDPSLPLDVARTKAVLSTLKANPTVHVLADPVGGYTQAQGQSVCQDVATRYRDVNVIIGSSQAIEGCQISLQKAGMLGRVKLVGNGGSVQAVTAVQAGTWFATFNVPEVTDGYVATKYGIEKLDGKSVPMATDSDSLGIALCTHQTCAHVVGQYHD